MPGKEPHVLSALCLGCLWGRGLDHTCGETAALGLGCACSLWSSFALGGIWVQLVCPLLLSAY